MLAVVLGLALLAGCGGSGNEEPPPDDAPEATPAATTTPEIAYASVAPDGEPEGAVHVMDADGANPRRVTSASGYEPDWSPDGTQLVFTSARDGSPKLYVINLDGSGEQVLTEGQQPAWSPDGSQIAYTGLEGDRAAVFVMNRDGTASTELAVGSHPTWSPDGADIAYSTEDGLRSIAAAGGKPKTLTEGPDYRPSWSPDGGKIAFLRLEEGDSAIYVSSTDGKAEAERIAPVGTLNGVIGGPTWSPDGATLVFPRTDGDGIQLFAVPADGSAEPERLTGPPNSNVSPAYRHR